MGQSGSKSTPTKPSVNKSYLNENKLLSDSHLYMSLEQLGYKLTAEQKQKAKQDGGVTFYQLGELNYEMDFYSEAYTWFAKAAAQKNSNAQTSIGCMYERKDMGLVDSGMSKYWYTQAHTNDKNKHAQCGLAFIYDQGRGVTRNYVSAIEWYERAARQNHPIAQFSLARIYEHMDSFIDLQKAVNWYKASYVNGYEDAKSEIENLKKKGFHPASNDKASGSLRIAIVRARLIKDQIVITETIAKQQKSSFANSHSENNTKKSKQTLKVFKVDTSPNYNDKTLLKKRLIIMLEAYDRLKAELDAIRAG